MRFCARALTAIVMLSSGLAGAVFAQGDEKTMEEYLALVTPELRTRIERARADFDHWPDPQGRAAAEQVLDAGEAAIPFLSMDLREGSPKAKACAAHVGGRLKARILFDEIVAASQGKPAQPYLREFFQAMTRIDAERAEGPILERLWEKDSGTRHLAYTFLDALVSPRMVSKLSAVLSSTTPGTRQYAIRLLARLDDPSVYDPIVGHLGDEAAVVAREASDGLSRYNDPAVFERLDRTFLDVRDRTAAFAIRTMVLAEDRHGIRILKDDYAGRLLGWTELADDRFVRAMGTVGLVNLGLALDDKNVVNFLDRWAVPVLIDTVGGGVFFDEYQAVRDLCFAKLAQVTGRPPSFDVDAWKVWWDGNRAIFKAVRGLKEAAEGEAGRAIVELVVDEPGRAPNILFFSCHRIWAEDGAVEEGDGEEGDGGGEAPVRPERIVLAEQGMGEILAFFKRLGFFELGGVYGEESARGRRIEVKVSIENLIRRVVVHGYREKVFDPLVLLLGDIARENRWQRYWDRRTFPEWQTWYEQYEGFWRQAKDPLERNRKLKSMLLNSYEFLRPKWREEAAAEFRGLMEEDAEVTESMVYIVGAYLKQEPGLTRAAEDWIRALAEVRQIDAVHTAIDFLLECDSPQAAGLMDHVLVRAGGPISAAMLRESESRVRAAACEAMGRFPDEEIDGLLMEATKDTSTAVQAAAAYSLGLRARPIGIPTLEELATTATDLDVRKAALVALGRIGTDAVLNVLIGALAESDPGIQGAAIRGLGFSKRPEAVSPVLAVLEKATDPVIRKVSVDALVALGGKEVIDRFLYLASRSPDAPMRLAAIRALGTLEFDGKLEALQTGLEDPEPEVAVETALVLARLGQRIAIPTLIQSLGRGVRTLGCETELARLTLVSFPDAADPAERAALYAEWWQGNNQVGPRVWLLNALRTRGYPVDTLVAWASGNDEDKSGCPVLVSALGDENWCLAEGASRALVEISGRTDLPVLTQNSSPEEREAAYLKWKAWWAMRSQAEGGGGGGK